VKNSSEFTRKQLDELTKFVQKPQIAAKGLVYVKYGLDGTLKSSVDKFFDEPKLNQWATKFDAKSGDLLLILAGEKEKTLHALSALRLEMAKQLNLMNKDVFVPLWVVDFPLLEWNEEANRFQAMHHPFTSPKIEDFHLLDTEPKKVRANAYDMVINGVEIGGGSIRIHDKEMQATMFKHLGFTKEEAENQFGFLMNAFKFGAPPHGGIALGFDRLTAMFAKTDSIRDVIAFPKNNAGKDVMIDSPSQIALDQLVELGLQINKKE
jgi:aspartyl-tRNA synthetase